MDKIIAIDYEKDFLLSLEVLIECSEKEFDFKSFTSQQKAIEELERNNYDILLLDYSFFKRDRSLISNIKDLNPNIYIIIVSATQLELETVQQIEAQEYCSKMDINKNKGLMTKIYFAIEKINFLSK